MYTAIIKEKKMEGSQIAVYVEFSDGQNTFTDVFRASSAVDEKWLKANVKSRLDALNNNAELVGRLQLGALDVSDIAPVVDEEKEAFLAKKQEVIKAKRLKELGILTDQDVAAKENELKALYKENYKDLI